MFEVYRSNECDMRRRGLARFYRKQRTVKLVVTLDLSSVTKTAAWRQCVGRQESVNVVWLSRLICRGDLTLALVELAE